MAGRSRRFTSCFARSDAYSAHAPLLDCLEDEQIHNFMRGSSSFVLYLPVHVHCAALVRQSLRTQHVSHVLGDYKLSQEMLSYCTSADSGPGPSFQATNSPDSSKSSHRTWAALVLRGGHRTRSIQPWPWHSTTGDDTDRPRLKPAKAA